MKRLIVVLMICVIVAPPAFAQLTGMLSGNLGPGSYTVDDSIWVVAGDWLVIEPGTELRFTGAYGFGVAGYLSSVGTETDSIKFIPNGPGIFWNGLEFTASPDPDSQMEYCLLEGSIDMGVFLNYADYVTIRHCRFYQNSSSYMGGGIYCFNSDYGNISHCLFEFNNAEHGGGVVIRYSAPNEFHRNVFHDNIGTYGGAMALYFSSGFAIVNCLFHHNQANAGGGIRFSSSPADVANCTFADNSAADGSGIFNINLNPVAKNLIVWGNTGAANQIHVYSGGFTCTFSDVEGGYAGVGNINFPPQFVTGPDGDYYLSQVAAGQVVNSPCVNAGDPVSPMIVGTTRTDQVQDAGVVDMGYHYLLAAPPPIVIALEPFGTPIIIPVTGGAFDFEIALTNQGTAPASCDVWTEAILPTGQPYPLWERYDLTPPPETTVTRTLTQNVPAAAPPGTYSYYAYVGNHPDDIWDQDSFAFEKSDSLDGAVGEDSWDCWGWDLDSEYSLPIPAEYAVSTVYPNPFNPATTLSFTLPKATRVNLSVYDAQGRLVATLVDGWRQAGMHEATFDGSDLASGVYIYQLSAGDFISTGKIVLMK